MERPVSRNTLLVDLLELFQALPEHSGDDAENGAEWASAMLRKMDKVRGIAKNGYWPAGQLTERPSTIFKEHVTVVAYPEDDIADIVDQAGTADFLVMGSDYPHSEGVAEPRQFVREALNALIPGRCRRSCTTTASGSFNQARDGERDD